MSTLTSPQQQQLQTPAEKKQLSNDPSKPPSEDPTKARTSFFKTMPNMTNMTATISAAFPPSMKTNFTAVAFPSRPPPIKTVSAFDTPDSKDRPASKATEGETEQVLSAKDATKYEQIIDKLLSDETDLAEEGKPDQGLGVLDLRAYEMAFDEVDDRISEFKEDVLVKEAFEKGVDLRQYAKQIEADLETVEQAHMLDYVKQSQALVDLHNQIQGCDDILGTMENLLSGFQADLGNISAEIQILQEKSFSMNIKLKNRSAMQQQLNTVLDGIAVGPDMIKKITESEVNEVYLQYAIELNKKMAYVKGLSMQDKHIRAFKDVGPNLEKLRIKATEKIREFLLDKIKSLRVPSTNIQILQQTVLLKYKELHQFVLERHSEAAGEIRQNYVNTMRWYFQNHFERYSKGLSKFQTPIADKLDLIGLDEGARKGLFSTGKPAKDKSNVFTLGERLHVLTNQDAGVIIIHVAESENAKYSYEVLFRSFNLTLMDNCSSEYQFTQEFFTVPRSDTSSKKPKQDADVAARVFAEIFDPTFKMGLLLTKTFTEGTFDAVGILLCVGISNQLALEMQRRRIPALESYHNAMNMILWPRFQQIMDAHSESLKKALPSRLMAAKESHPHYITRRYGEFASSVLVLSASCEAQVPANSLHKLRGDYEVLLLKMAAEFSDKKSQLIFLINNYDLLVTILQENGNSSRDIDPELEYWKRLLDDRIAAFVTVEITPHFGALVKFVGMAEREEDIQTLAADIFEKTSAEFNSHWRASIAAINTSVIQHFSNFKTGTTLLQAVLGQVVVEYTRFIALLDKRFSRSANAGSSGARDGGFGFKEKPVGIQNLMVEIKKIGGTRF